MFHSIPLCSFSLALLAAAAAAQQPLPLGGTAATSPSMPDDLRLPVHTPAHDGAPDHELWAAGADYKVSFHDGLCFIPYLGKAHPQAEAVRWTTHSVRVGAEELTAPRGQARPMGPFRVEYPLGAVVEAYDVRSDGVEQTFVVARRPAASGPLVVRGTLGGTLDVQPQAPQHGPLVLCDASGRPTVRYGAAVAVDATGRQWPMQTAVEHGEVTLTLTAAAVAAASFPLVVDPMLLVEPDWFVTGATAMAECAVGTDGSQQRSTLVAYTRWVAADDSDVYAFFVGGSLVFSDLTVGSSADQPSIASVAGAGRWVLAYRTLLAGGGVSRLRVHVHAAMDNQLRTNSIGKLNLSGVHDWRPCVGGTAPGSSGVHAMLVYQQESTPTAAFANTANSAVMGMRFDASTTNGTFDLPFVIAQSATRDSERPAIDAAAAGTGSFSWVCVFQQFDNAIPGDDWDLLGKRIDQSGQVAGGSWSSSLGQAGRHQLGPIVAGANGRYAVLFTTRPASSGKVDSVWGNELRLERFDWTHGLVWPDAGGDRPAELIVQVPSSPLYEATGLAADPRTRSHWGFTARTVTPTLSTSFCGIVGHRGQLLEGPASLFVGNVQVGRGGCAWSWSAASSNYKVAFATGAPANQAIQAGAFVSPSPAPIEVLAGCVEDQLTWSGPVPGAHNQLIGCELSRLTANAFHPADIHLLFVSLDALAVPIVQPIVGAGCQLLVDLTGPGYLGMLPPVLGLQAEWALPLPESLPAMTLQLQNWLLSGQDGRLYGGRRLSVPLQR